MIKVTIDNVVVEVEEGSTILTASVKAKVKIPTLCYLKGINEIGGCRMCVVEVEGVKNLVTACTYPVTEGMIVRTNSPRVRASRKCTLELLLSDHNKDCLSCERNGNCELQALSDEYDCDSKKYSGEFSKSNIDDSSVSFVRDNSKCIKCRKCVAVCQVVQSVDAIGVGKRGFNTQIGCAFEGKINESTCVNCGQCLINCPTGALTDKSQKLEVLEQLAQKKKRMIVAMAPSVRVTLGEHFGSKIGENVEGKMISALRRLGFDDVFDIDFGADLTIMEESHELISALKSGEKKPLFTSCCPSWVKFVEIFYPEFIKNISTCKSPQQMMSATIKTFYAEKLKVKPSDLYFVSIMPCIAKKFERLRDDQSAGGMGQDTDAVLTVRDLTEMIKVCGIDFMNLEDGKFDEMLGLSSGAGVIFGATGGVMEAALRTLSDTLEKNPLKKVEYLLVRGISGTKEAEIDIAGKKVKLAVVSGLNNARTLLEKIKSGEKEYDFVEVMACPGGCANGGGMPIHPAYVVNNRELAKERADNLYASDVKNNLRKSHENPSIKFIYENYFGKAGGEKAHKILHTTYIDRSKNLKS
ncbi:MAG: 2Fe-2S iron-sulfur cluster binding domain-containing protein [Clostridia bacterium]|nr:2Fe-2S iron-sulfur cluster binding domain-containing protein [Clostridia bacterium]